MKLLIVAGPYEADRIRRAAVAAGSEAVAVEASDSLPAWIAASRPDVIILAAGVLHAEAPVALARVRDVPGGDVPVLFLCDAADASAMEGSGDGVFARPVTPEAVVRRAAELIGVPLPSSGDFAAAGSSARRRTGSDGGRGAAGTPVPPPSASDLPVLRPLERDAQPFGAAGETVVKTPWLRRIAASIDDALDAEMEQTLASLAPGKLDPTQPTRHVPAELVAGILAVSSRAPASPAGAPVDASPTRAPADAWLDGDLATTDMATLLGRALLEGLTGRLRVRRDAVEKSVFFEAGRPVLAVSNVAQDRMVQMLVRQGRLSSDQASRAMALATETGRRMGAVLIDLGFMKSSELLPAVRQHYEELITSMFAWDAGGYRIEVGAVADPRRVRLLRHPAALMVEGLRRAQSIERLRATLAGPIGATDVGSAVLRLEPRGSASDALLELAAGDPAAQRLPVLFDGVRTLREVVRVSGLPEAHVLQLAIALRALGLLARVQQGASARREPVAARDREIDRERITARHALVREGDYFEVLGIDRAAGDAEVRAAYEFLTNEFAEDSVGPELAREHRAELAEIREVLDEALHVLGAEPLRRAYVEHLPSASGAPRNAATNIGWGPADARAELTAPQVSDQRVG